MKIFGVALSTIVLVLFAYVIGAKYPGPVSKVLGG
jgi:hypothetical protein